MENKEKDKNEWAFIQEKKKKVKKSIKVTENTYDYFKKAKSGTMTDDEMLKFLLDFYYENMCWRNVR